MEGDLGSPLSWTIGGIYGAGLSHGSKELVERHLLSMYFMLPLIGVCIGFMYHNWYVVYPSKLSWYQKFIFLPQVPGTIFSWRHILLFQRNGFCSRGDPGPLLKDSSSLLYSTGVQFLA